VLKKFNALAYEINMKNIIVTTEILDKDLISEALQLFHKNSINKNYNYWQFKPRFNQTIKAITARVDGVLIGFNATMPIKLNTLELTEIDAIWSCDFIVDKEYRKKGVGHLIKTELKQKFPIPTIALGISDPAIKVLKREGWQQLDGLKVYKKTLRPDSIKTLIHHLLGILQRTTYFLSPKQKNTHNVQKTEALPSTFELNRLWKNVRSEYEVCIARNAEYIQWRYSNNFIKGYSFLTSYTNKGILSGLLVYRIQSLRLRVIDYLGSITKLAPLRELLITLENFPQLKTISFNASNIVLTKQLIKLGYVQSSYQSKFACYMPYDQSTPQRWLLTAGDSDGEFIQAIAEQNETEKKHLPLSRFTLTYVNEIEFDQLKSQWQQLLDNSPVDKLFMSWLWMNTWWHTWKEKIRETYNSELAIILIKKDDELVGIIPLYKITKSFAFITYTEYQLLGNAWRIIPSVRSEYIEPIFSHKFTSELMTKFALWIKSLPINSTLIWPDNPSKNLATIFPSSIQNIDYGAKINLNDKSFSHYITTLGKNTRLKGITRQKLLSKEYPSHQWGEFALSRDDVDCFFELLNNFHIQRWGKVCFDEYAQKFHKHLILANSTLNFQLLYLKVDNQIVSVLFNIIIDNTVYNIQSGFDSLFNKKYSLGTMHLLFSIEQNFHQHKYAYFDLLAGQGLNTAYKNHYKGEKTTFVTYQVFSLPAIAFIFRRLLRLKKVILTFFNR
jgi:hypothetical protein